MRRVVRNLNSQAPRHDIYSPEKRSEIMSRVRSSDTGPELRVRKLLHALGFRYRLHSDSLPGKPDIVLSKHKKIIMVHGCFWHQHKNCPRASLPVTRLEWWRAKLRRNQARDQIVARQLRDLGWSVGVIWECQTKNVKRLQLRLLRFVGMTGNS
ncbi:MAG: DNA mismatch endonuclease Vsr [Acidobacteriia bacterium]|nr:DNA mismatch endonuclease Vsr [Terriglobia bacterium]